MKQVFLFLKQSNGEYMIKINPAYLFYWRSIHFPTPLELDLQLKLNVATWNVIKEKLKRLSYEEKCDLLKRQWDLNAVSVLEQMPIPESLKKHFLKELENRDIII